MTLVSLDQLWYLFNTPGNSQQGSRSILRHNGSPFHTWFLQAPQFLNITPLYCQAWQSSSKLNRDTNQSIKRLSSKLSTSNFLSRWYSLLITWCTTSPRETFRTIESARLCESFAFIYRCVFSNLPPNCVLTYGITFVPTVVTDPPSTNPPPPPSSSAVQRSPTQKIALALKNVAAMVPWCGRVRKFIQESRLEVEQQ